MNFFDLHSDTFSRMYYEKLQFNDQKLAVNINELKKFSSCVQTLAVWLSGKEKDPKKEFINILNNGTKMLGSFSDDITIIRRLSDLKNIKDDGRIGVLLSLENGTPIYSAECVDRLYSEGIRTVSLTWNDDNHLAGGAKGKKGLTSLGREVIFRLNHFCMVLDVSHLNRKSFFDAVEIADNVIATHSGIDSLMQNDRNLTDEQIKIITNKNGIIGLCFYPQFIGPNVFEGVLKAIKHLENLGCYKNISIGSDFDGCQMSPILSKSSDIKVLAEYLFNKGIDEELINKVFYENAMNYYSKVLN